MDTISFKRHRFPPDIIRRAVWLYARFALSYRDVEDLLAERGLDISYESVRRWFLKFGAPIARNLRHTRPIPNGYWPLDERVIVIRGQRYWLWRAVDNEGEVLDFLVQSKRNAQAALKLMRKLLKKQGWTPTRITTDKLRSYHVAIRTLGLTGCSFLNASELVEPIRNSPAGIRTNSIPTLLRTSVGASEGLSAGGDGGGGDGGDTVRAAPPLLAGARADAPNLKLTDQSAN